MEDSMDDFNAPFSDVNRQDSTGNQTAKSFKSVQTSFTQKGHGWECRGCSMLNSMKDRQCELCGAPRHNVVASSNHGGDNAKSNKTTDVEKEIEYHKRTPSNATVSSKSSKETKQSEVSKRSTIDPPAAEDAPLTNNADTDNRTSHHARQTNRKRLDKKSRKASNSNMHENNKHVDSKSKPPEISGPEAIQSLSCTPLAGEGTTQAIAQLLGLTQQMNLEGDGGTLTVGDSKYSGSKGSHTRKTVGEKSNGTAKSGGKQHSGKGHGGEATKSKRTTFSKEVQDISNGGKLNKKIQGDRDRVDKIKAIKRGEAGVNDVEGEEKMDSDLCPGAKPFVPSGTAVQGLQKKGNKGKKKAKGGEIENEQSANGGQDKVDGDASKKGKKQPKKKNQKQQPQTEPAPGTNLTLQAIQQSKQKKGPGAKQKKDKPNSSDHNSNKVNQTSVQCHESKAEKEKKKQHPKQQTKKPEDDNTKPNPKKKDVKSKENSHAKAKAKAAASTSTNLSPSIPPNQPQTTNDLNYGAGRPIVVVHIAEKPSIAQAIAQGLNNGGHSKSVGKSLPTHEFVNPPFPKAPKASKVTHRVSSVAGHVFNVDFPKEYQSWDTVDPAELFHAPLVKKPCKGSVVKHLQDIAKGSDFIVLWMDCDREGENINFEILDCISGHYSYDRVYRAHFSAINPSDIQKAYSKLGKPDRNQSLSVDARQELDLKVGVAFSRFQTRYFQGRYGDLDSAVLSYGPCQTPTLGFCVQRHLDIEMFKPEPYWSLDLGVMNSGTMCRATWDTGRSFNRNRVEEMVSTCRNASPAATAKVTSLVSKEKKQGRPMPLNTVALLKACSKALGIGPHAALNIAERLYLSGYLSYPRTESTKYPSSFDIKGTLQSQTSDSRWGSYVSDLLKKGPNVGKGGVDMGDHPPITPCRHARAGELSGDSARVYDLVARHFIASVSEDAVWKSTTVCLSIKELGEKGNFTIRGKQMVTPGFLAIVMYKQYGDEPEEGSEEDEEEKVLPEFQIGDQFGLTFPGHAKSGKVNVMPSSGKHASLDIKERMTTPPTYLTESELISKMEHHGIGTDASISTHIENILKRNYVELISGRKLKPSRLGLVLAQGYHLIDDSLVLPKIRSDIEDQCVQIAKGLADRDAVVKRAIEIFSSKFSNFCDNISKMDVLFSSSFAQLQDVGKPFTRCGFTRRYLQFITGPPPRLYNKTTETVYPLPIGGEIKQWTGRNCPVAGCNFELCLYSVGAPPRTFPLCPNCFNSPKPEWGTIPGENTAAGGCDADDEAKERQIRTLAGKNMIRECPHPDNHPLIAEMTVSPDPESDGVLILDPHLGPKWRLVSTREPTIVHLPKSVDKVTILDKKDEVFGCHMMYIEFKPGESPIEGKNKYTSCFANDETLQALVRVHHGDDKLKASSNGRGRGSRGRGGRGRGRGGRGGKGRR